MLFREFLTFYSATACAILQILFRSERVKKQASILNELIIKQSNKSRNNHACNKQTNKQTIEE